MLQLQLLLFAGLAFFVMLPMLRRTLTITLDTDWLYRRLAPLLVSGAGGNFSSGTDLYEFSDAGADHPFARCARLLCDFELDVGNAAAFESEFSELAPLARDNRLIVTHGNGPQVGLLALEAAAVAGVGPFTLDHARTLADLADDPVLNVDMDEAVRIAFPHRTIDDEQALECVPVAG